MSEPTGPDDLRAEFRLRPQPPRVVQLSRKVVIGLGTVAGLVVAGTVFWSLGMSHGRNGQPSDLYSIKDRPISDALRSLPKDYSSLAKRDVPKLGPPLPGDLGRPIRRAEEQGKPVILPAISAPQTDPTAQKRLEEKEAARVAKLFVRTSPQQISASPDTIGNPSASSPSAASPTPEAPPADLGAAQNMQDRKLAFINGRVDRRTVSPDRVEQKASPYVLQAGSIISAALVTGIRSDLPGEVTAQVTENVYDSPTGRYLLVPQGAKLIGQYDSQVAFGQSRVLLVWTRLIMPDGSSIVLERLPGTDTQGFSGLKDRTNYHWGQFFKAAALSTLLGVGTELGSTGQESDLVRALRQGSQNAISDTGRQVVGRQLNIQPTLTIRPGFPVRVIVERDLVLQPYRTGNAPS